MRDGLYEVHLIDQYGNPIAESTIEDKVYAHAAPSQEFSVRITVHKNPRTGRFPFEYLRLGLFIDGHDVNYWKRMDLTVASDQSAVSASFQGWKKNTIDLRAFVFSSPALASAEDELNPQIREEMSKKPLGQIKIIVHEATVSDGIFENKSGFHEMPPAQKVSEGKKFWQQASLTTTAGRRIESDKEKFTPLQVWKNISPIPNHEMVLNYHTFEMIKFIETFTEHQRRMQAYVDHNSGTGASSNGTGLKRKREEKPAPIVVDLTEDDDAASSSSSAHRAKSAAPVISQADDEIVDSDNEGDGDVRVLDRSRLRKEVDLFDMSGEGGEDEAEWQRVNIPQGEGKG